MVWPINGVIRKDTIKISVVNKENDMSYETWSDESNTKLEIATKIQRSFLYRYLNIHYSGENNPICPY
ncbi:MAG: hypothetical protein QM764_08545 [Chitinophagaceae bacterium]